MESLNWIAEEVQALAAILETKFDENWRKINFCFQSHSASPTTDKPLVST